MSAFLVTLAHAEFDPAKVVAEPPAISARFPGPPVTFDTPGFRAGRTDFPSHAEVLAWLDALAARSANVKVEILGRSQQGRPLPLVVLAEGGVVDPRRPTVLVIGQQHGNEPAGGETVLALAEALSGPRAELLKRVNVLLVPRGNPDGAEHFDRVTVSGADVNRDHLLLGTPEGRAIAAATLRYAPQVALDLHEFTVGGRWVDKFGVVEKYDGLLQAASVGNLDPQVAALAEDLYLARVRQAFAAAGLLGFAYHTTNAGDREDKVVSMGGVQPDTGRNVSGLRPAVSLLLEVRGVGLGRQHFARRVYTQYLAAMTVIETAAGQGDALIQAIRDAGARAAAQACRGDLVVEARQTATRQTMTFLDAKTGEDRVIEVDWRAADPLEIVRKRARPCGYVLAASETQAVARLKLLGVNVVRVRAAAEWPVERYQVIAERDGRRQDARGAIDDAQGIRVIAVLTVPRKEIVPAGSWYVTLAQPLSPLISAALEPDSQNGYAASKLLAFEHGALLRVMAPPAPDQLAP